jgi:hypothetical protein
LAKSKPIVVTSMADGSLLRVCLTATHPGTQMPSVGAIHLICCDAGEIWCLFRLIHN